MNDEGPPEFIKLLAHNLRWRMLRALGAGDMRVNELVNLVDQPMNLISYHLKRLRDDGLVVTRRSEADGRDVYYALNLDRMYELYMQAGIALHPGLGQLVGPTPILHQRFRVLFICTHNSARSQMAEALMRHLSAGQVEAHSAGSTPTALHPDTITTLRHLGVSDNGLYSKDITSFVLQKWDAIITVCDNAREVCPRFPGSHPPVHWGLSDPTLEEDPIKRAEVFLATASALQTRIRHFLVRLAMQDNT